MSSSTSNLNEYSFLGQDTVYPNQYDASLLVPIPRQTKRSEIGLDSNYLPFSGLDLWTAFEVSWLNHKGKPVVGIAEFIFDCASEYIIESKSFKLYLNSFNNSCFPDASSVVELWETDLSVACGMHVKVKYSSLNADETLIHALPGTNIDHYDIDITNYQVSPHLLQIASTDRVEETLNSHLLKSNCLVTNQPDWGSVVIRYEGSKIDPISLLRYIVSFRNHDEFHEQCVERIFHDILQACKPVNLTVYARYVRRGGLDINPYRSNFERQFDFRRTLRQ